MSYTYVTMDVSKAVFNEIAGKLREAGYDHAFMDGMTLDMRGIALVCEEPAPDKPWSQGACESAMGMG